MLHRLRGGHGSCRSHPTGQSAAQLTTPVTELQQRKPDFSCAFARERLFFLKDPGDREIYLQGLRQAGVPE